MKSDQTLTMSAKPNFDCHTLDVGDIPLDAISVVCSSSKDEDRSLKDTRYPVSVLLSNFLFEPVIDGQVFVNQETPHLHLHPLWALNQFLENLFLPKPTRQD